MARSQDPDDTRELDVRDIDGEPYGRIVEALQDLSTDETLTLVNSFEPEPLYAELDQRGFDYRTRQVEPDEWRVHIERA